MKINKNRYSLNFETLIVIDFQYQSINCYWLLLILLIIDYHWMISPGLPSFGLIGFWCGCFNWLKLCSMALGEAESDIGLWGRNWHWDWNRSFNFQCTVVPPRARSKTGHNLSSLRKHAFLFSLRRWRNVPSGEEWGETDVFAGYNLSASVIKNVLVQFVTKRQYSGTLISVKL